MTIIYNFADHKRLQYETIRLGTTYTELRIHHIRKAYK